MVGHVPGLELAPRAIRLLADGRAGRARATRRRQRTEGRRGRDGAGRAEERRARRAGTIGRAGPHDEAHQPSLHRQGTHVVHLVRKRCADVPGRPRPAGRRRVALPADRAADQDRPRAGCGRGPRPANGGGVRRQTHRAHRPALVRLPARALLRLARRRRALGDEHPAGDVHAVRGAFRLDREVIKQLGWDAPAGGTT
jgi:hypothetical protein